MKTIFQTLLIVCLVLGLCGTAPQSVHAAIPAGNTKLSAGLSVTDWGQIKAQLPVKNASVGQQAYLKASNTDAGDWFGYSVAISGDTVVVGARWEASSATGVNGDQADNSAGESGAAYVFVRNGTTWSQQAYLKASNTDAYDMFGYSVAISGDTVVVGARDEASSATGVNGDQDNNSQSEAGAAYVFTRSGSTWSQQAYLKASNTEASNTGGDRFGSSVAIFGDTVVVGAIWESSGATGVNGDQEDNSAIFAGAVYVFTRSGGTWSQQAYVKASNTDAYDYFGWSVAISGDTLVVGADQESSNATGVNGEQADNSADGAGAVYVFARSGAAWSQQAYIKASNTDAGDRFGRSVAISGDTVVVGADLEDSNATGVNGNQADNSASSSGAAYVFTRSGAAWRQQASIKASNTDTSDYFGDSVSVYGDTVVVGAGGEDSNSTGVNGNQADNSASSSGAAYVFTRSGAVWRQQAYIKASNTDAGDWFGSSVAISGDTVVVGADGETSNTTGVNGNQADNSAIWAGAAYIFVGFNTGREIIKNGGFNTYAAGQKIPRYWKAINFAATDGKDTKVKKEGIASVKIVGVAGKTKALTQTILLSGGAGDAFTLSFWAKASAVPVKGLCQVQVSLYGGSASYTQNLKCPAGKIYNWRQARLIFAAPMSYTKIIVKIIYSKASGTVWLDKLSLLR